MPTLIEVGAVASVIARRIPESLAREYDALAVALSEQKITVAFPNPPEPGALRRIERATGLRVEPIIAPTEHVRKELSRVFGRLEIAQNSDAPAVRATDRLHERAFFERCSDIHIEPRPNGARVRFRIDGFLRDAETLQDPLAAAVASRIKILAGMDITDNRRPQDGRYTVRIADHAIDMRVSSVPARDGEKLVIRLLDHHAHLPSPEELGMPPTIRETFFELVRQSCGFVVVCGPTGSGKTTTLYAALAALNAPERNVCTVEDPVEQAIDGITQVQVNVKAGVTFASVLRSLLRQDPNVIMVGEMRDAETANTAVSAALSGQMVFTTLHSNDAPRAVERLCELQVTRSSLAAGLTALLGQRLVRRLCPHCKQESTINAATARKYGLNPDLTYRKAQGCEHCDGVGYYGRIGIFELLTIDDELRDAIASRMSSTALAQYAHKRGYRQMADDCAEKLAQGLTSIEEFGRIAWWGTQS
jgi:type II secretory ATPase GspE/PulE/Tfp pilus assembly ATPase PilB-like protein